jgi:nucleoside phosphorylase
VTQIRQTANAPRKRYHRIQLKAPPASVVLSNIGKRNAASCTPYRDRDDAVDA